MPTPDIKTMEVNLSKLYVLCPFCSRRYGSLERCFNHAKHCAFDVRAQEAEQINKELSKMNVILDYPGWITKTDNEADKIIDRE